MSTTEGPAVELDGLDLEGSWLVGLPVAVSMSPDGAVTVAVCLEDLTVAMRDEDASAEQLVAAERAYDANAVTVTRT